MENLEQNNSHSAQQEILADLRQDDRKLSGDPEVGDRKLVATPQRNDPFGDEEFAEVKYRTMTWW